MTESPIKLPEIKAAPKNACMPCVYEEQYGGILLDHACAKKDFLSNDVNSGIKNDQMLRALVDICNKNPDYDLNEAFIELSPYPFVYGSLRDINTSGKNWLDDLAYPTKEIKLK